MTRLVVGLLVIGALGWRASPASADERDGQLHALVAAQIAAINGHDAKAFANTFDEDATVILPAAADEGRGAAAIEAAAARWFRALGTATVKLEQPHYGGSWFDAQLVVATGGRLRITGVTRSQLPDMDRIKLAAVHISEPIDDKLVLAKAGALPALPPLEATDGVSADTPDKVARFAGRMHDLGREDLGLDEHDVVIGSSSSEYAVGKVAGNKLLSRWRGLKMRAVAVQRYRDQADMLIEWYVAHVEVTFTVKGKPVSVPYRALTVVMQPWATAAQHGATSGLASAHFSIASH
jgi:hypothetical protein